MKNLTQVQIATDTGKGFQKIWPEQAEEEKE